MSIESRSRSLRRDIERTGFHVGNPSTRDIRRSEITRARGPPTEICCARRQDRLCIASIVGREVRLCHGHVIMDWRLWDEDGEA